MELLADVHVKQSYVTALRSEGHSVDRVVNIDQLGPTARDEEIKAYATDANAVVLTNDAKDFDQFEAHSGVVIVPQSGITPGECAAAVTEIDRLVPDLTDHVLFVTNWID